MDRQRDGWAIAYIARSASMLLHAKTELHRESKKRRHYILVHIFAKY